MAFSKLSRRIILLLLISNILSNIVTPSSSLSDPEILLKFRDSLDHHGALSNWDPLTPPCNGDRANWEGVFCTAGTVWGLKLENMGLKGSIDVDTLGQMKSLITISVMLNNFEGPLPDLKKINTLKTVYLNNNKFSGTIPDNAFEGMGLLKKIQLSRNSFSGPIPKSLATLDKLVELMLEDNHFEGQIPDFPQERLKYINLANNNLEGPIPEAFSSMSEAAFAGNKLLCGPPLPSCTTTAPHLSVSTIVIVVILLVIAVSAIIAVIVILGRRGKTSQSEQKQQVSQDQRKLPATDFDKMEQGTSQQKKSSNQGKKSEQGPKLSFLTDDREKFDLADLLKASAEILGGGMFGSTYKAALPSGELMVVKRFRHMNNVGKEEFQEHMRRLGRLKHPNLLPIVAFYYRKEEKLLVSGFVNNNSLAVLLHGNRSRVKPRPDWPARLKIVKGVTKGLVHLHNELPSIIAPHGHLKSSNVLLNKSFEPLLNDYGLIPIVNQEKAQEMMIAYKSPEHKQHGRITKKTDVWTVGTLILEIMTGKFPTNYLQGGKGSDQTDLADWVKSMTQQDNISEVFDKDMGGTENCEGQMIKLLKIGLECCEADVEKRWDIKEAAVEIEELVEKDG